MDDYVLQSHARKLTPVEASVEPVRRTWYVTHHAVFNPNKPGKCRVVFDGSLTHLGYSLNSELLKGLDFLPSLPGVLLRFRQHATAIVADIEKMFLQVRVRAKDGPAFRYSAGHLSNGRTDIQSRFFALNLLLRSSANGKRLRSPRRPSFQGGVRTFLC